MKQNKERKEDKMEIDSDKLRQWRVLEQGWKGTRIRTEGKGRIKWDRNG